MSSDVETREVETSFGTTEVNVVECTSCEVEISVEDAYRFAIANSPPNHYFNDVDRTGYACELCADEPASFPEKAREFSMPKYEDDVEFSVLWNVVLFPVLSFPIVVDSFYSGDQFATGYFAALISTVFWMSVLFGLWLVL